MSDINLIIRATFLIFRLVGLGKESLFGESVDWRNDIIRAILPCHDCPSCSVNQANFVNILVVLGKRKTVRKLPDIQVQGKVELSELFNAVPDAGSQSWHLCFWDLFWDYVH